MIAHLKGRDRALEPFGLSGRRAEWIALASLHGGVFTRAQLSDWLGASRFKVLRLVQALTERRLVAEETVGGLKVCRVCARGIYRALGAEDVRFRRITSTEVVVRRLLSFDYVIEHPSLPWLPTESEKVGAFEALGIDRALMPARVYRGAAGGARRYFPHGMPVALDSRRAVFVHADPGYDTSTALHSWRDRHRRLWEALREDGLAVEAVGVACARRPLDRARTILGNWTHAGTAPRPVHPPRTIAEARRETARIEGAILGMDDEAVADMGGFQACLRRIAEMRELLRSARPEGTIDVHSVMAVEPPVRSPDLSAVRGVPLPIRRRENDIGVLVQGNRALACGTRVPQVAGRLGGGPQPADRRCRSGSPGRGRERPGPSVCPVRHRGGSACASPCRPLRRVAPRSINPLAGRPRRGGAGAFRAMPERPSASRSPIFSLMGRTLSLTAVDILPARGFRFWSRSAQLDTVFREEIHPTNAVGVLSCEPAPLHELLDLPRQFVGRVLNLPRVVKPGVLLNEPGRDGPVVRCHPSQFVNYVQIGVQRLERPDRFRR